jgi:glycosyltransferase involved in cell wall biosynthesis
MTSRTIKYSIIVPVYNRPEEVDELLKSLVRQTYPHFEVVLVEDGSTNTCRHLMDKYVNLSIQYLFKPNSGPGPSRNEGFAIAKGEYFVVFDSDCIIPATYLEIVENSLNQEHLDAWGGPDKAHDDFTLLQKAMGYTMASVFTTGGIRGGKQHIGWFQPRSFNMGMSRKVYEVTGGFQLDRFAEDIDLSIRMRKAGFKVGLIEKAFVYHKRRTSFQQFFKQVYNFGRGRVLVGKRFPSEVKLTHWFPTLFTFGLAGWLLTVFFSPFLFKLGTLLIGIYFSAILLHGAISYKSIWVGLLSVPAAIIQLTGYGLGFISEKFK